MCLILRPASRDQIRDRAVSKRPSVKSSEAFPKEHQQRPTRATGFLPTSGPSFVSGRLDHPRHHWNRLRTWVKTQTWKPPDQSSLHDFCRTGTNAKASCKLLSSSEGYPGSTPKRIGGAERDRTADPLLAKQVLSQLSYSPNHRKHLTANRQDQVNPNKPQFATAISFTVANGGPGKT